VLVHETLGATVFVPGLALGPDGVNLLGGWLVDVVLQAGLEIVDVVGDGQELDDFGALDVRVAVELTVLGDDPFSLPEYAAGCQSFALSCLLLPSPFSPCILNAWPKRKVQK
jgi:hypothetical protein